MRRTRGRRREARAALAKRRARAREPGGRAVTARPRDGPRLRVRRVGRAAGTPSGENASQHHVPETAAVRVATARAPGRRDANVNSGDAPLARARESGGRGATAWPRGRLVRDSAFAAYARAAGTPSGRRPRGVHEGDNAQPPQGDARAGGGEEHERRHQRPSARARESGGRGVPAARGSGYAFGLLSPRGGQPVRLLVPCPCHFPHQATPLRMGCLTRGAAQPTGRRACPFRRAPFPECPSGWRSR